MAGSPQLISRPWSLVTGLALSVSGLVGCGSGVRADHGVLVLDGEGFYAEAGTRGMTGRFDGLGAHLALGAEEVHVRAAVWGRGEDLDSVAVVSPQLGACVPAELDASGECLRRIEYVDTTLTEWWSSSTKGFQQGWIVEEAPVGRGLLTIAVGVERAVVKGTGPNGSQELALVGDRGGPWRVDGLAAWDADGEPLEAQFVGADNGFAVVIDDAGARYPVMVDPVYSTATTTLSGSASSLFGTSASNAGDVNNDGYDDVIVGAPGWSSNTGRAYLHLGSASGVSAIAASTLTGPVGTSFGTAVAAAGDVNNDGFDDVIIGAPGYSSAKGRAYVYRGTATGVSTTVSTTLTGGASGDNFGTSVSSAGDVNNDGYADVIVGAYGYSSSKGRAYVYKGSATGISTTISTTLNGPVSSRFGYSVSDAGDVNSDGYDDVIVGAYGFSSSMGRAYVYIGSSTGISITANTTLSGSASSSLGCSVSGAGDVDNDGYADVIVGASGYNSSAGRAYVHRGSASGVSTTATTTLDGAPSSRFGSSVSGAGDVDDDGHADVIVGAPNAGVGGEATLHTGSAAGVSASAITTLTGAAGSQFGASVSLAGDTDTDAFSDLIIGAYAYGSDAGMASVYHGFPDGDGDGHNSPADCDDADASVHPGAAELCDGGDNNCDGSTDGADSLDVLTGYADVDADGFGDLFEAASACVLPLGYVLDGTDCDDLDDQVQPGHTEYCDDLDNDCDGDVDGDNAVDQLPWYADVDGDAFGDASVTGLSCDLPADASYDDHDCDDTDALVSPNSPETCNGRDDDCDGDIDEAGALDELPWYADDDADGFGSASVAALGCNPPTGFVADATDCDDGDAAVSPSAVEACNLIDDDCDALVDEAGASGETVFHADVDEDGHGDAAFPSSACFDTAFTSESDDDCDDTTATTYTGAPEYCNDVDDDCNEVVDDPTALDAIIWYADADADGYGASRRPVQSCEVGPGYVTNYADCSPSDARSYPGAPEACDSVDNSCDGVVDEPGSAGQPSWYADADGDSFGAGTVSYSCSQPPDSESSNTDCDDTDASVSPAASESCNGFDDDCDGSTDEVGAFGEVARYVDADGDNYGDPATASLTCDPVSGRVEDGTDCDDSASATYPGAPERCDGVQNDCSLSPWSTSDEDGEVWLSDGEEWTSFTAEWAVGSFGYPAPITLPASGTFNVCDGTYHVTLTASAAGTLNLDARYDGAVLSAGGAGTIVTVSGSETYLALRGLTLQDGSGSGSPTRGGALRVTAGTVTVDDCLIQDNTATSGGGFAVLGGTVTMTSSEVSNNTASATTSNTGGGGWYQSGGTVSLTDTDVVYNTAARDGGGGYLSAGTFTDTRGDVSYNTAQYSGGGLRLTGSAALTDTTVAYNGATTGSGGGVHHSTGTLTMNTPAVQGNTAAGSGGGVYQGAGALTCIGSTSANSGFFSNTASIGGGVYLPSTSTFQTAVCGFGDTTETSNSPVDIQAGTKTYDYADCVTVTCRGGSCR